MAVGSFSQLISSPLLAKAALLASSVVILAFLRRRDTEQRAVAFLFVALGCLARDVALAVLPWPGLALASDIALFGAVLAIAMEPFPGTRPWMALVAVVSAAGIGLLALRSLYGLTLGLPLYAFNAVLLADAAALVLVGALRRGTSDEGSARLIGGVWIPVSLLLAAYGAATMVLGYGNDIFERLVSPLSYAWLLVASLAALRDRDDETLSAVAYYEASIDSLYNLSFRVGTTLKGRFSVDEVMGNLNEVLVSETGADGGAVYLVDEFDDLIVTKAMSGSFPPPFELPENLPKTKRRVESFMRHAQFRLGETVLGEIAKTGKNVYAPEGLALSAAQAGGELEPLSSFMAVPLMIEDKIIGVSAVSRTRVGSPFTEAEFDRFKLLANFGTLAVSNLFSFLEANERSGLERSAGIAAEIQAAITPKRLPQFPRVGIGAFSAPAHGVSGDYYDVMRTREDRVVGVVGDVAGKGVQAALVIVMMRSILQLVTNTDRDVATILDWVNKGITGKIDIDHYATLGIIALNVASGELEYANAAHQALLVYRRASDSIETVDVKSVPIGVERGTPYVRKALRLAGGDIVALYTDGVVEAMNEQGRQFGRKSLGQLIARHRELEPHEIAARIKAELGDFRGDARQHDDQTVLVFKMKQ